EKAQTGEYRCLTAAPPTESSRCSLLPAGFLLNRLRANAFALPLTSEDLDALKRWAEEHKPEWLREIETLKNAGVRLAVALRTSKDVLGMLLLGQPVDRAAYGTAEQTVLNACAAQFALMIENARLTSR